jgi:hypothetical protein
MARTDVASIETALDAARVVDDFVRGVVGLGEGEIGGAGDVKRRWTDRVFGKWVYSQRHVVHGMAGAYGHDQLRKASIAAADLTDAVAELARSDSALARSTADEVAPSVSDLPELLLAAEPGPGSSDVLLIHQRLNRVIGVLSNARTRALLAEMRASGDADPPP